MINQLKRYKWRQINFETATRGCWLPYTNQWIFTRICITHTQFLISTYWIYTYFLCLHHHNHFINFQILKVCFCLFLFFKYSFVISVISIYWWWGIEREHIFFPLEYKYSLGNHMDDIFCTNIITYFTLFFPAPARSAKHQYLCFTLLSDICVRWLPLA